jgi:hypothetical protein
MGSIAPAERSIDRSVYVRFALAVASIAAGLIHAAVVPDHLAESSILGLAFAATAVFQVAWAAAVSVRWDGRALDVGVALNGAIVVA